LGPFVRARSAGLNLTPLMKVKMTSTWGSFPRVKIGDQFMLIPAGRSGVDFKLIMKTPEPDYHYTISVSYPSASIPWQLPIYAEKTLETHPKAHHVIGRGTVNLQKMVESIIPAALPTIRTLGPGMGAESGSEFIAFTPQLVEWFGSGEITIDERTLSLFQPVSYTELRKTDFALGMPVGVTGSGLVIRRLRTIP
jgi:hypothetical protein